jgi:hypothetical protein
LDDSDDLNCAFYYNYYRNACISYIPNGYYCNSTEEKTIDKCYERCKTCTEGGTDVQNNCHTCITNYYKKQNDTLNNCYNNLEGYYLNNDIYEPCYSTCKSCEAFGTINDNKCTECLPTHMMKDDYDNDNNCYEKCIHYYYYDEDRVHHCTNDANCPTDYNKVIQEKKRCIDNCQNDNKYKMEYNGRCYIKCPPGTQHKENNTCYETSELLKSCAENKCNYQTKKIDEQNNDDFSIIKLGKCEDILKTRYNISNESLILLKVDAPVQNSLSSIVEYEIYHPISYEKLNLTHCQGESVEVDISVKINEEEVFKYDPSSDYYNDVCSTYTTENGTDIILKDRQNEYVNNNLALCETDCTFMGYDYNTKKAKCKCSIKTQITQISQITSMDKDKLIETFLDFKSMTNLHVLKCYKLLFSKEGFLNNIGNYILLPIITINIVSSIIFPLKGYNILHNLIKEMANKLKEYQKNNSVEVII